MSKDHDLSAEAIAMAARQFGRVLDLFVERLLAAREEAGGQLKREQLDAVLNAFKQVHDPSLIRLYVEIWEVLEAAAEEAHWSRMRNQPLERLIVHAFEDLLAPRGEPAVPGQTLTRRILPGFLSALKQMVGPEMLEEYERRARELVTTERAKRGDIEAWRGLADNMVARTIVWDVMVYVARYFTNVPKRRNWMIDQITRNLSPAMPELEANSHFADEEFHRLMARLYQPLAEGLAAPNGRAILEKRYGPANMATLEQVLIALEQDRQELGLAA